MPFVTSLAISYAEHACCAPDWRWDSRLNRWDGWLLWHCLAGRGEIRYPGSSGGCYAIEAGATFLFDMREHHEGNTRYDDPVEFAAVGFSCTEALSAGLTLQGRPAKRQDLGAKGSQPLAGRALESCTVDEEWHGGVAAQRAGKPLRTDSRTGAEGHDPLWGAGSIHAIPWPGCRRVRRLRAWPLVERDLLAVVEACRSGLQQQALRRLVAVLAIMAAEDGRPRLAGRELARAQAVEALCQAMRQDPAHAWQGTALASRLGCSREQVVRLFVRHCGLPPGAWLTECRMRCARQLLRHGGQDLAGVAAAVGYGDVAAFGRAFRRRHGLAPGRWRTNLWREDPGNRRQQGPGETDA